MLKNDYHQLNQELTPDDFANTPAFSEGITEFDLEDYIVRLLVIPESNVKEMLANLPERYFHQVGAYFRDAYSKARKFYIGSKKFAPERSQELCKDTNIAMFFYSIVYENKPEKLIKIWKKQIIILPETFDDLFKKLELSGFNFNVVNNIIAEFFVEEKKIVLDCLAKTEQLNAFVNLLSVFSDISPDYETYDNATESVKKFLDYRPGKKILSVYENARKNIENRLDITKLFLDYDNSTDEDSSDAVEQEFETSESDEQFLEQKKQKSIGIEKKVNKYAKEKNSGKNQTTAQEKYDREIKKVFFLLFRGEHYRKPEFTTKKIHDHYNSANTAQPVIHDQLLKEAKLTRKVNYSDKELALLMETYEKLQKKYETEFISNPKRKNQLIQYHVSKKSDGKSDSPFISYSIMLKKALMYATNLRRGHAAKREPHYRKSTGIPKHPNCGYVNVFLMPANDFFERYVSIPEKQFYEKTIKVNFFRENEMEVVQLLFLPKEYNTKRIIIAYPNLNNEKLKNINTERLWDNDNEARNTILENILERLIDTNWKVIEKRSRLDFYRQRSDSEQVVLYPHVGETVQVDIPILRNSSNLDGDYTRPINPKYTEPYENVSQEPCSYDDTLLIYPRANELFYKIYTDNYYKKDFILHSGLHHARTAIYAKILYNIFKSRGIIQSFYNEDDNFIEESKLIILQALALCHDIGRDKDIGGDQWVIESYENCKQLLQAYFYDLTAVEAEFYSNFINEMHLKRTNKPLIADILHDADTLDVIRDCRHGIFYYQKLALYKHFLTLRLDVQFIFKLIEEIIKLIDSHGDIHQVRKEDSNIVVKDGRERGDNQIVRLEIPTTNSNNNEIRKQYNESDCFERIEKNIQAFEILNRYYFFNQDNKHDLDEKSLLEAKRQKTLPVENQTDLNLLKKQ